MSIGSARRIGIAPRTFQSLSFSAATVAVVGIGLVAFVVRLAPVIAGGGLLGIHNYDDGVYFGASIALVHGVVPYRDFLLLHPPGIVIALVPFAALGELVGDSTAFAVARLSMMGLGAINAILVAVVAGRYSRAAGLTAGILYAVWSTASNAERSTDLHAVQNTLVLLGLLVLCRRGRPTVSTAAIVGAAIGLAVGVQLWHVATLVVVAWWIAVRTHGHGWRRIRLAAIAVTSAAAAFAIMVAPFLVADAGSVIRDVIVDQAGRPGVGAGFIERIRVLEGFPRLTQLPAGLGTLVADPIVLGAAFAAFLLVLITARTYVWTRPWAALAVTGAGAVLVLPSFVNDYASFIAPAASLVLGTGMVGAAAAASARGVSPVLARGSLVLILGMLAVVSTFRREGDSVPLAAIERDIATARCVATDTPTLAILTSALRRSVISGCPIVLDPTGMAYDHPRPSGRNLSAATWRKSVPGYQRDMADWYGNADAALFARTAQNALTDATNATIASHLPVELHRGIVTVRLPKGD